MLATFYAGDNSADISNNSGWLWSSCIPTISDVWPGDANNDKIANNKGLLNIGVAYGETGKVRPSANLTWTAQPAEDWFSQFADWTNTKHADCDGNGIVNADDTMGIVLNYGMVHAKGVNENKVAGAPLLYLDIKVDSIQNNATVVTDINFGTSDGRQCLRDGVFGEL